MFTKCIRGAITVDENTKESIISATSELITEMVKQNDLAIRDVISIFFTATNDLDQAYPSVAARNYGFVDASLMCLQELYVVGSLEKCIRVCMFVNTNELFNPKFVYLKGAKVLRPDKV